MSPNSLFNNIAIEALGLAFVLERSQKLSVSKALLISPIISHEKLLGHLARSSTNILSFDTYFIEHLSSFSNFNRRFYSEMVTSVNAIQMLWELGIVAIENGNLQLATPILYDKKMGKRAEKIYKAAPNISAFIDEKIETLYLNLRIEL